MRISIILILSLMCCSNLASAQGIDLDGLATLNLKPDLIGASQDSMTSVSNKKFGGHLLLLHPTTPKISFIWGDAYIIAKAYQGKFDAAYLSRIKELDQGMYIKTTSVKMGIFQIYDRAVYIKEVAAATGITHAFIRCTNKTGDLLFTATVQVNPKDRSGLQKIINELIGKLNFKIP